MTLPLLTYATDPVHAETAVDDELRDEAARLRLLVDAIGARADSASGSHQRDLWVAFFAVRDAMARLEEAARCIAVARTRSERV
jgi:hypothetical protein